MQKEKVLEALNILKERGIISNLEVDTRFMFTARGRQFTKEKSGNSWISITNYELAYLWARSDVKEKDSWIFIKVESLTEEQFEDFCKYFEVNIGPELYDAADDVFEDI